MVEAGHLHLDTSKEHIYWAVVKGVYTLPKTHVPVILKYDDCMENQLFLAQISSLNVPNATS